MASPFRKLLRTITRILIPHFPSHALRNVGQDLRNVSFGIEAVPDKASLHIHDNTSVLFSCNISSSDNQSIRHRLYIPRIFQKDLPAFLEFSKIAENFQFSLLRAHLLCQAHREPQVPLNEILQLLFLQYVLHKPRNAFHNSQ